MSIPIDSFFMTDDDQRIELALRIRQVMHAAGENQAGFSRELSESPQNISNYINGRTERVPSDFISKIIDRYPGIDAKWLLTGRGEMFAKKNDQTEQIKGRAKKLEGEVRRLRGQIDVLQDTLLKFKLHETTARSGGGEAGFTETATKT